MHDQAHALVALPVYNEVATVDEVLSEVRKFSRHILVVDDGSTDGTADRLAQQKNLFVERHPRNRGYGAGLKTAFEFAIAQGFEVVVTIDCDGQHEPCRIPRFIQACRGVDIVSGSRYLKTYDGDSVPPPDRRLINHLITEEINDRLGFHLTDAFCGFKAYRVEALKRLEITEPGYAMPLELWVQAAAAGLKVIELPVPLIYLDAKRSFGGALDNSQTRLDHYREIIDRSIARVGFEPLAPRRWVSVG